MFSRICRFCRLSHQLRDQHLYMLGGVRFKRRAWHRDLAYELYRRRILQGPEPERPRSVWSNWNYNAEIYAFGQRLGEDFKDETLKRAFLHRSYLETVQPATEEGKEEGVKPEPAEDNTELIHTGGEFITTHVKACLRAQYPRLPEESVRSVCEELTSQPRLANLGSKIGVKDLILSAEFPVSEATLRDTFQAVIGALLQDQGSPAAGRFVQDFVLTQLVEENMNEWLGISDPVGLLHGIYADEGKGAPESRLLFESGASTLEAVYMVGIYSDMNLIGKGYGESVNIAEEMAARDALSRLFGTSQDSTPIPYSETMELSEQHYEENRSLAGYYKHQMLQ